MTQKEELVFDSLRIIGLRNLEISQLTHDLEELRAALTLIASCLCAVGSGCREPKLCVVCIARKALADTVSKPEKTPVQP